MTKLNANQRKGAALKHRRLSLELDVGDVSKAIDVPIRFISHIERGGSLHSHTNTLVLEKYHKYLWDLEEVAKQRAQACGIDSAFRPESFTVEAGRYEGEEENCKYCNDFSSLSDAMRAFDDTKGYPWRRIVYFEENGNTGVDISDGFADRKILYRRNIETGLFDRI